MILLNVTYTGHVPGVAKRRLPRMKKAAYTAAAVDWHQTARPKHFSRAGAREYNYKPRKGERGNAHPKGFKRSYTGRKLAKYGHTLPLVYSGLTQGLTRQRDVRATATGCKVVIHAPGLNRRHPKSQITMRLEMTAVSDADRQRAVASIDAELQRQIQHDHTQHTIQI